MDRPILCANSCGFHGSVETKNMCSVCYKDHLKEENVSAKTDSVVAVSKDKFDMGSMTAIHSGISLPSLPTLDESVSNNELNCGSSTTDGVKIKNRCQSCNRKVGVLGFQCRCGDVFCQMHRYPESHSCHVDYKKVGRQVLAKQNPLCKGDKLKSRV